MLNISLNTAALKARRRKYNEAVWNKKIQAAAFVRRVLCICECAKKWTIELSVAAKIRVYYLVWSEVLIGNKELHSVLLRTPANGTFKIKSRTDSSILKPSKKSLLFSNGSLQAVQLFVETSGYRLIEFIDC